MNLETKTQGDWHPCSDSYLRGFCLSTEKYRETREKLESGEVTIRGRTFQVKEKNDG